MIKLEVTQCPNMNLIGEVLYFTNELHIGSDIRNHLYLPVEGIQKHHLKLTFVENRFLAQLNENIEFIHVNGKRTTANKFISKNDTLKFETVEIKILEFEPENPKSLKQYLNEQVQKISTEDPERMTIIQDIEV